MALYNCEADSKRPIETSFRQSTKTPESARVCDGLAGGRYRMQRYGNTAYFFTMLSV